MNFSNSSLQFPTKNIEIAFKVCNFLFARHSPPVSTLRGGGKMPELQISEISQTSYPSFYSTLPFLPTFPLPQKSSLYHMYWFRLPDEKGFSGPRIFVIGRTHTYKLGGFRRPYEEKLGLGKRKIFWETASEEQSLGNFAEITIK